MRAEDKEAWLAVTSHDELQVMRVQRQIREELERGRARREAAREATSVRQGSVHRLRARLAVARGGEVRSRSRSWALAGAVALTIAGFCLGRWALWPVGVPEPLRSGEVALQLDGLGTIEGTREQPVIQWESGTVEVEVTPNQGVSLSVVTPEAQVRVVGTAFSVERSDFATHVAVSHGTVEVTCAGQAPVRVSASQSQTCLPDEVPTLLRRVSALRRRGAPASLRLDTIARGLAAAEPGSGLAAELWAHRAELLAATGEALAAREAADAYLAIGGPRDAEMTELKRRLSAEAP